MTEYIFDTNVFITPQRNKYYHFDTHPAFWQMLEQMLNAGTISSIHEVFLEITGKNRLKRWVGGKKIFFRRLDNADHLRLAQVTAIAQSWAAKNSFNASDLAEFSAGADTYLLARALEKGLTIVTYETPYSSRSTVPSPHRIKVPDVANLLAIPCINLHDFLVAEGIRFDGFSVI